MIRYLAVIASLFLLISPEIRAQGSLINDNKSGIYLVLSNIRPGNGLIRVGVFTSEAGYPDKPVYSFSAAKDTLKNGTLHLFIPLTVKGPVSFCILDDENRNEKMDYVLGIMPREGFAFSNNPKISLRGAPPFSSTSFRFNGGVSEQDIRMIYMR